MYSNTETQEQPVVATPQKPKKSSIGTIIMYIVSILLLGTSAYLYYQYDLSQKEIARLQDPEYVSQVQQDGVERIIEEVGDLMLLPDEEPTVATLVDVESLKADNPDFYANAVNGDTLLIYQSKAILYRESEKKIINVAPVFIEPTDAAAEDVTVSDTDEDTTDEDTVDATE